MKRKCLYIVLEECTEYTGCDGACYFKNYSEANQYYKYRKSKNEEERITLIHARVLKTNSEEINEKTKID